MDRSEIKSSVYVGVAVLMLFLLGVFAPYREEGRIPFEAQTAVGCVIGEAEGEGFVGMLAVSSAIRNRRTLKGVAGCNAHYRINNSSVRTAFLARLAWNTSYFVDIVYGSDHWGSTLIDEEWIETMENNMMFVRKVGNHRFYRRKP